MTILLEMSQPIIARGDELSDAQLGLLLADLQLDGRVIIEIRGRAAGT